MIAITLPRKVPSQNDSMWKHWTAYTKERDVWFMLIRSKLIPRHNPPAEKIHASILSKRHRLLDYGNLVGGAKPIPDALKKLCYIVDDNPKWFECDYRQEQTEGVEETILTLWASSEDAPTPAKGGAKATVNTGKSDNIAQDDDKTPPIGAPTLGQDGE